MNTYATLLDLHSLKANYFTNALKSMTLITVLHQ